MGRMNTMKWAVYFLSFFGATGCTPVPVEGAQDGVLVHQVSYDLLWSEEDPSSDTVVNHLGFTVSIELAYLVHYSMQLVPCREDISARHSLWSPWTAVAGHGDDNDASVSSVPVVEAIHARAPHALGTVSFSPNTYCGLHYLIGPATPSAEGLPEALSMVDRSVYVRGHWSTKNQSRSV